MADIPPADDWWLASDGKYYPPETHPDFLPPPPTAPAIPSAPEAPENGPTASWEPPAGPPLVPPPTTVSSTPEVAPPAAGGSPLLRLWWLPLLVGVVGLGVVLAVAMAGGDDDSVAASGATPTTPVAEPTAEPATTPPADATEPPANTPDVSPTPGLGDPVDVTPTGLAGVDDPAGFGQEFGTSDWRLTIVDAFDADEAGLVSEYDDPLADGMANLAILYEITYVGSDLSAWVPVRLAAIGSESYDAFLGCYLDFEALEAIGVDARGFYELVPGQTQLLAECAQVPADELDDIVIEVEYDFLLDPVYFDEGGQPLPPLSPIGIEPGPPDLPTLAFGEVSRWGEWSATIVELLDAQEAGLINRFSAPPREGNTFVAVVYDVTNISSDDGFDPVSVTILGTEAYGPFNGCFLDDDAMTEIGLVDPFDDVPEGSTKSTALCFEIPVSELDNVVYRLESFSDFEGRPGLYSAAG